MGDGVQKDALGGAGSLEASLQSVAVNGLSRTIDGFLSTKYPLTSFNEPYTVEGGGAWEPGVGYLTPRSAPQRGIPATQPAVPLLQNPLTWGVGAVLLVVVVLVVALKK